MAKATTKIPLRQQPAFKTLRKKLKVPVSSRDLLWYYEAGECVEELFPIEGGRLYGKSQIATIAESPAYPVV